MLSDQPLSKTTSNEKYEVLIWGALPLCAAGTAGQPLNVRSGLSIPSLAFVSTSAMSGFISAGAAVPLIMEHLRINFDFEYSQIFIIWLIMVGTIQITKLILLTPYTMPVDKSAIDLYSETQVLSKFRNRKQSMEEKIILSSTTQEAVPFTFILKGSKLMYNR